MMEYHVAGLMSRNTNIQPNYPPQIVLATVTPIDEGNTQIFMLLLSPRDRSTAAQHQQLVDMTENQVMDEDYAVLKTTRPRQAAPLGEELLVEADLTLVQVRGVPVVRAGTGGGGYRGAGMVAANPVEHGLSSLLVPGPVRRL